MLSFKLCFAVFLVLGSSKALNVEIQEYWGNLNTKLGDTESITCSASEVGGSFSWLLDGAPVDPSDLEEADTQTLDDGTVLYSQAFYYRPELKDDGKELECSYTASDFEATTASDSLEIFVSFSEFPVGSVNSGEYEAGLPAELEVAFKMHPAPTEDNFVWIVNEGEADEIRLKAGSPSQSGYTAKSIESVGSDTMEYIASLVVASVGPEEVQRTHTLRVNLGQGISESIPVEFQLHAAREPAPTDPPKLPEAPLEQEEEGETTTLLNGPATTEQMSVGLFIIVAFIALILLICIGYCVYHKCCKKDPNQTNGPYQATATKEP